MDLSWEAWAQALVMLSPIVIGMIWCDWRERRKSQALWKRIEDEQVAFDAWVSSTVRCPACGGCGRVRAYAPHVVGESKQATS